MAVTVDETGAEHLPLKVDFFLALVVSQANYNAIMYCYVRPDELAVEDVHYQAVFEN
jgi:hypothetical protein